MSEVRFADVLDGWAFGPSLFATHDGGRTWTAIDLGGPVVALATSDGVVDAVVSPCKAGQNCTGSYRLVQAPAGGGYWRTVLTGPAEQAGTAVTNDLSLQQGTGFVLFGDGYDTPTALYATGGLADPGSWKAFPNPCAATGLPLTSFVAPDTRSLYSLCSGDPGAGNTSKVVTLTIDGHTQATGSPPRAGDGGTITATPAGVVVVANSSGADALYRSTDGGAEWGSAATYGDGGMGLHDLGFTTSTQGIVVRGQPGDGAGSPGSLLMTRDAGQTWQPVTFG